MRRAALALEKLAFDGDGSLIDQHRSALPASPAGVIRRIREDFSDYPSVIPWTIGGGALGLLAGFPPKKLVWRVGERFMDTDLAQNLDAKVRAFSHMPVARYFSPNEFGLAKLRPLSSSTIPMGFAFGGAGLGYSIGRQRAEEALHGPLVSGPQADRYAYIPRVSEE